MNQALNTKDRYLNFFLGDELYGIEIYKVREIIAMMKITKVPKTPKYITGIINLRGSIIPVIDTRLRFDMPFREYDMQTAIIITQMNKLSIGFIVDKVEEVVSSTEANLCEPPKFGTNVDIDFINKMIQIEDTVIMIIDIEKLFTSEEELVADLVQQV